MAPGMPHGPAAFALCAVAFACVSWRACDARVAPLSECVCSPDGRDYAVGARSSLTRTDPGLKAPLFQALSVKMITAPFNLNPCELL